MCDASTMKPCSRRVQKVLCVAHVYSVSAGLMHAQCNVMCLHQVMRLSHVDPVSTGVTHVHRMGCVMFGHQEPRGHPCTLIYQEMHDSSLLIS